MVADARKYFQTWGSVSWVPLKTAIDNTATDPEPPGSVLGRDFLLVVQPVAVPPPDGGGIMNADCVNAVRRSARALRQG